MCFAFSPPELLHRRRRLLEQKDLKTVFLMLKRRRRRKTALALALLLTPVAAYGVYMLLLFFFDSFRGDGLMLYQYDYESRRELAVQLISHARQALPLFYALGLLLWVEIQLMARSTEWNGVLPAAVAGILTGILIPAVFVEMSFVVLVPSVVSALLMALVLAWTVRPSRLQG